MSRVLLRKDSLCIWVLDSYTYRTYLIFQEYADKAAHSGGGQPEYCCKRRVSFLACCWSHLAPRFLKCMGAHVHTLTRTRARTCARTHMHTHAYTRTHKRTHVYAHVSEHAHARHTHTHMHTRTHTHTLSLICTHTHACTQTHMHTHTETWVHEHAYTLEGVVNGEGRGREGWGGRDWGSHMQSNIHGITHVPFDTHTYSHAHKLAHAHAHTHTHTYTYTFTRALTHTPDRTCNSRVACKSTGIVF